MALQVSGRHQRLKPGHTLRHQLDHMLVLVRKHNQVQARPYQALGLTFMYGRLFGRRKELAVSSRQRQLQQAVTSRPEFRLTLNTIAHVRKTQPRLKN
jgi:hypothetical protein